MVVRELFGILNPQSLIRLAFRLRSDREFLIYHDQRLTRKQVYKNILALAAGLQALGVEKGDRVVTLLPACPEAVYALFLPHVIGSVNVPLNPLLQTGELRYILRDCKPKAVLTTRNWYGQEYPAMLAKLIPELPALRWVIVAGLEEGDGNHFIPLNEVMRVGETPEPVKLSPDDVTRIAYTSGTTGWPKGVIHTRSKAWGIADRGVGSRLDHDQMRCLLLPFPPYHVAGMFGIYVSLLSGGRVILMERLNPQRMLAYVQDERVTRLGISPTMGRMMLGTPGQEQYDLSSLRVITFTSESCPLDLARKLYERTGCRLENIYSTSECNLISWTGPEDGWEQVGGTVGVPVPGAQVRIVDDRRTPMPPGESGEIAVRTRQMMQGYLGDPELTAQVLDDDGWYYTGDIGYLDDEGYLHLIGRTKDLIIRGGENVSAVEVERFLELHPAIRRAGVIGVPHPVGGEAIWACLEAAPGVELSSRQVLNYCRGEIAPYKIPERIHWFERLPTTATGKLQKYKLREWATQELRNDGSA
jgi:fatty-acyl-CoA synthase